MRFLYSILLFILLQVTFQCVASCQAYDTYGSDNTVTLNNATVQRDAPVGTVIATAKGTMLNGGYWYMVYGECDIYANMLYGGMVPSGVEHVYNTNVPGVGIRAYVSTWSHGAVYASASPGTLVDHYASSGGFYGNSFNAPEIALVKTGNITPGVVTPGPVLSIKAANNIYTGSEPPYSTWTLNSSVTITQVACSVTSGEGLSFPIGNVPADQFKGKGSVSSQTSAVNLKLDCDPAANINVTLSGTQNPDSSDDSVLTLTGQGEDGIAEGVGVQLVYNDKPLEINKMLNLKTSAGGMESFTLVARYIQTKDNVVAGSANATATLNLTYQ